jgi:hypothetical protein
MSINQNNNKYTEKIKNHPVFQDQILRPDTEIKKIFDTTFTFCKELIQGDILNELECYEEDDEICEYSDSTEKTTNNSKENQKKHETNHEKSDNKKTNYGSEINEIEETFEYTSDDEFEENKSQYALLLTSMRLYKLFEHILLKKYIYELVIKNSHDDIDDFEKAIVFFKSKKIILNEDEEQAIYLLQHLSDAIENSFLYKNSLDIDYTMLTEDEQMTNNIDPNFLLKTIEIASTIVERIYST